MSSQMIFYILKPIIPRRLQLFLRRKLVVRQRLLNANIWPIDEQAGKVPNGWLGWPENKRFSLILSHDVETAQGQEKCYDLINLEKEIGFRSSFNFVPERYNVSAELRQYLTNQGFEVGVHGLNHDGKLYNSKKIFKKRSLKINKYLKKWGSIGFRSPSMHHNLNWIHYLNIKYDSSTFDTDPFEPQPNGVGTIFPYWVGGDHTQNGYVELPYTLPQDYTLFVLMKEKNIDIWKRKLDWIFENGGMALMNTHPDYMNFNSEKLGMEKYPVKLYEQFLTYVRTKYEGLYWNALPMEATRHFLNNHEIREKS